MITLYQYFGHFHDHKDATPEVRESAEVLIEKVNKLMDAAFVNGIDFKINPSTMSHVAGTEFGGFRPQSCPQGSPQSSHKTGQGVDVYDGPNSDGQPFAKWCLAHLSLMEELGLYMEHPDATKGKWSSWVHLTTRAPKSGRRIFLP